MKIKIFTQNTWLVPFPFSKHGKKRSKHLVAAIKDLKPDIVALQEVALKRSVNFFKKNLKEYNVIHNAGRIGNRSGLLTLTKERPQKIDFFQYKKPQKKPARFSSRLLKFSKRGIHIIKFKDYYFYNTHLFPDWDLSITSKEFETLKKKIKKDKICFVAGDLNISFNLFENLNKGFFEPVDSIGDTFSIYNQYVKKWWDRNVKGHRKIDYILVHHPKKTKLTFRSRIIMRPLISDHYGILSEIEIK
jgi:exonuclease III